MAKEFKELDRAPIIINTHTIVLLRIYESKDRIADIFIEDFVKDETKNNYKNATKQFISQFEGNTCPAFDSELSYQLAEEYKNWCKKTKQLNLWWEFKDKINEL